MPSRSQSSAGSSCQGPVEVAPAEARFEHDWRPSGRSLEEVPTTTLADFANELAKLRTCLSELRRENMELRSGAERQRQQPRSLASSTLDLALLNRIPADHAVLGVGQPTVTADSSVRMETLTDNAEASLHSNRFNPLSG